MVSDNAALTALDEQQFKGFHWQATLTTGLGVFCDGYDLSSLALVLGLVLHSFRQASLTGVQSALLSASALVGAASGALLFGVLGQGGRKRFYGVDVLILGIAAIAQAFAPNVAWLIGLRFALGVGVGADYVLSPVIMAEHSNRADRGRALGLGFGTMWPIGALAAVLLKFLLAALHVPDDLQWRLVLAGGAVPALGVLYFRRRMPETVRFWPRWPATGRRPSAVTEQVSGARPRCARAGHPQLRRVFAATGGRSSPRRCSGCSTTWSSTSSSCSGRTSSPRAWAWTPATFAFLTQVLFVLPASFVGSLFIIDRFGRKPLQAWGFLAGAVLLGVLRSSRTNCWRCRRWRSAVYGLLNIGMTGPGLVSGAGILGVELAPTRVRSVAQSITVAGGRIGAAISGFAFPLLFRPIGHGGVGQFGA